MDYTYKFKQSISKTNIDKDNIKYVAFIFDDLELKSYLLKKFNNIEFIDIADEDKAIKRAGRLKRGTSLITNSPKVYRKISKINSYLYKKDSVNCTTSIYVDETFDKENIDAINLSKLNYFVKEKEPKIANLIKSQGRNINKVIVSWKGETQVAYKTSNVWRVRKTGSVFLLLAKKLDMNIDYIDSERPFYLKDSGSENIDGVSILDNKIYVDEYFNNSLEHKKLINWLCSDIFVADLKTISKYSSVRYEKRYLKDIEESSFNIFCKETSSKKNFAGYKFDSIDQTKNQITFKGEFGEIKLTWLEGKVEIIYNLVSHLEDVDLLEFYTQVSRSFKKKLNIKEEKKKMTSNIFKALLGFIVFIVIAALTFIYVFDGVSLEKAYDVITSPISFNQPWIYILTFLSLITLGYAFINAWVLEKVVLKRKFKAKRYYHYFISTLISRTVGFLTGNYFMSTFAWGWYLKKKNNVDGSALVSVVAASTVMKAILHTIIGTTLMSIGTFSYLEIFSNGEITPAASTIIGLSWAGYLFDIFSIAWMALFLSSSTFLSTIAWWLIRVRYIGQDVSEDFLERAYRNVYKVRRDSSNLNVLKNKEIFFATLSLSLFPVIIQGFQMLTILNWVDSYFMRDAGSNMNMFAVHTNFFQVVGLTTMSGFVRFVPGLNLIPGSGIGVIEFGLSTLFEALFASSPNTGLWGGTTPSQMAEISALIYRSFTVYLLFIIAATVTIWIIVKETILKRGKR